MWCVMKVGLALDALHLLLHKFLAALPLQSLSDYCAPVELTCVMWPCDITAVSCAVKLILFPA